MANEKKKLVLMIPQMRHGGAERVVSRLSFLMSDAYDIRIVVFDDSIITYEVGCEIISLNAKPDPSSNIIKKVYNTFKRIYLYSKYKKNNNIETTYSFGDTANFVNVFSLGRDKKIVSIRGFKRIRTGKGKKDRFIIKPLLKKIFNKSDAIVSVSELMSKTIIKEYDIPSIKVNTSYNGYDVENIQKLSKEEVPKEFLKDISQNRVIVTAGTYRSEKGYWHLLKAFALVLGREKDLKLVILGQDYRGNRKKVEKLAKELNISDNIIYGGYQSNPFKYFSKSSIYVLSSTFEGFPNSMVEAMACHLPVVASDCKTGPREILAPNTNIYSSTETIEMGEFGVLVQKMNEDENYEPNIIEECDKNLAKALLILLKDEDTRLKYASKSIQRVSDFDYLQWSKQQNEIITN
ncbi:glycosyltransferase [Oceanobacillus chungangensis]|uniref:Glycosyl transferase family 1 domain-containing protein n=1 Tax=Oceanobacillus chungangensis TaxID=1229152 RepID=A0A3D8PY94_9BACI|nr:glycosyltransferase [Oceanobacillus chungangensis]RDW20752.1 hypothetical protein CWR45_05875 [Oceanobacillus chungangensis]